MLSSVQITHSTSLNLLYLLLLSLLRSCSLDIAFDWFSVSIRLLILYSLLRLLFSSAFRVYIRCCFAALRRRNCPECDYISHFLVSDEGCLKRFSARFVNHRGRSSFIFSHRISSHSVLYLRASISNATENARKCIKTR